MSQPKTAITLETQTTKETTVLINARYYSPTDLQNLTDGELLDLVYYVTEDANISPNHAIAVITELLALAKGGN